MSKLNQGMRRYGIKQGVKPPPPEPPPMRCYADDQPKPRFDGDVVWLIISSVLIVVATIVGWFL